VGTPRTYTYTVNPTAVVNAITNQVVCNGSPTTAVTFGTTATGGTVVYNWTNNTTSIGLGASGTGNIPSFTGINTGTAPVTATITVTPTFTNAGVSCVGTPRTYTYTVNPTAVVNAVASQILCNATPTAAVNFSSPNTGGTMTYNWTNNTPSIGLAASGTGNIPSFTAINTGIVPVTATITVTPSFTNGGVTCTGAPITFTIQVKPTPTVNAVTSQAVCNGFPTTAVSFTGAVAGTVFSWTNSVPSIGLAASGTGNIASFVGINTSNNPIVAVITVTPSVNGCTGASITFTITVNPQPTVTLTTPLAAILPNQTTSITATTNPPGGNYLWFLNNSQLVTPPATPVLTPITVDKIGIYKVIYTDLNGCVTASSTLEIKGSATEFLWVYPNPNSGQFVVRFYNQPGEQVTVNVYDALGQVVFQKRVVTGAPYTRLDVDLRNKAAGYYMVNVMDASGKTLGAKRVLVSH
jgi:Secretion system C-terminal sorting domain/PKD-like domain